jgi:hypothetical protein
MHGKTSYLLSRQPSQKDLEERQYHYITSEKEWDPMSGHFAEAEMNVPRFIGTTSSHAHRSIIQPEYMATRWGTSVDTSIIKLEESTAQRAVHTVR